ncbi:RNA-directed DNA polymerase, eukaryota [Tanacetum coccineum]|uniref:RNA-directed DNA polymerase, eukaryota n=1 Tax=Tanacetum coccineum TaxID=301880 RepID=A0ABQ5ID45_9ASTR
MPIDKESPPAIVLEDDCLNAKDLTLSLMGRIFGRNFGYYSIFETVKDPIVKIHLGVNDSLGGDLDGVLLPFKFLAGVLSCKHIAAMGFMGARRSEVSRVDYLNFLRRGEEDELSMEDNNDGIINNLEANNGIDESDVEEVTEEDHSLSHPPGFTPEEGLNEGNTVNLDMKDYGENERIDIHFVTSLKMVRIILCQLEVGSIYGFESWMGASGYSEIIESKGDLRIFCPISLTGSLYKIIAKILANQLVGVLGDLVNEVQSAFVADRQILDSPFILDEVLQWCRRKKKHAIIFKVDFEKAFDSVRWDFVGLDAGLFTGININSMVNLSHLFYADDAIFLGQWSSERSTKCFLGNSGIKVLLRKDKGRFRGIKHCLHLIEAIYGEEQEILNKDISGGVRITLIDIDSHEGKGVSMVRGINVDDDIRLESWGMGRTRGFWSTIGMKAGVI